MNKKIIVLLSFLFLTCNPYAFTETVILKSGKTVEGKILETTDKYIKVDISSIPITYYNDEIVSIDGKSIRVIKKDEDSQNVAMTSSNVSAALQRRDPIGREEIVTDERLAFHLNKGLDYSNAGRHREAIAEYQKALQIDPNFIGANLNMGASYKYLGEFQKAIEYFQKVLTIDPKEVNALNNLAAVYVALKRYDEAIICYKKAIEIMPKNTMLYEGLGLTYGSLGQNKDACEWFQKAIQIDPKDPSLYYDLGVAYFYLHEYAQAKTNLLMAKELYKARGQAGALKQVDNALSKIP